jgi:16S rRNA (guanine966-N2)-methyltransferase
MRISGGSAKGRKVGVRQAFASSGEGDELRPTSAKVREAIFNILAPVITDARFLDLFAGAGAVGLEALSRGARETVFVEKNAQRCALIKGLTDKFRFTERSMIMKSEVAEFLKKDYTKYFDIIFIDPPYASDELEKALLLIDGADMLADGGLVLAEHASKKNLSAPLKHLRVKKNYRYGDTALTLFELGPDE